MKDLIRARLAGLLLVPLLAVAACERSPTGEDHAGEVVAIELYDRANPTQRLAWTDGQGAAMHWDGALPTLQVGQEIAVNVRFLRRNGAEIPLGGSYTVRARPAGQATGSAQTAWENAVVRVEAHGDHVDIIGRAAGETQVAFLLWHGSHADWDAAPPITVRVQGP
jgi:hypothetical protein